MSLATKTFARQDGLSGWTPSLPAPTDVDVTALPTDDVGFIPAGRMPAAVLSTPSKIGPASADFPSRLPPRPVSATVLCCDFGLEARRIHSCSGNGGVQGGHWQPRPNEQKRLAA